MSLAEDFLRFDDELARFDVPPLSAWWREQVRRYFDAYERGEALEFWACVGRGGSKSTALYKLATYEALFGSFTIPSDERHYAIVLSRVRSEAEKGLLIISSWLKKLRIDHRAVGDTIDLDWMPRGIRVVTASVASASGWRAFFLGCDEFAKWAWDGALATDAEEVIASARAMLATHPRAKVMVASSPWISEGMFYQAVTGGDGEGRVVTKATPSWVANPIVSEASTRLRERNERRWRREYAAEFVDSYEGGFFPEALIASATDRGRNPVPLRPTLSRGYTVAIDPAFSFDRFAVCVAHAQASGRVGGGPVVVVDYIGTIDPPHGASLSPEHAAAVVCNIRRTWPGDMLVRSDQAYAAPLQEIFMRKGVALYVEPWTGPIKLERFMLARSLLADGRLRLPDCAATRRELNAVGLKMTVSGNEVISTRGAHDDRVSALVHATFVAHHNAPAYGVGSGVIEVPRAMVPRPSELGGPARGAW
jgi:hypothetical protein